MATPERSSLFPELPELPRYPALPPDFIPAAPTHEPQVVWTGRRTSRATAPPSVRTDAPTPESAPLAERRRIQMAGRIGRAPVYGRTPKGQAKLTFQLAEHLSPEETVWHTVVAFGERADKFRGQLRRGDAVDVIGYEHQREVRGRDGQLRTSSEIYATVVRPLLTEPT